MRPILLLITMCSVLRLPLAAGQPPNDEHFDLQWGLLNTGQEVMGQVGATGVDVAALEAWQIHSGTIPVIVAIVGRGIDPHPEFEDRLLEGKAFVGDLFNTFDTCPYDTHLAGIIAATRNNNAGVAGLNDHVYLLPVRVFDGCEGPQEKIAEGIIWAADQNAAVILVPFQLLTASVALRNAVSYATDHDSLVVAPAGSQGNPQVVFPAALPNCLAVSATTNQGNASSVSNWGPEVDLAAPGQDVWSTWIDGSYEFLKFSRESAAAAAFVAGTAALIRSYAPQMNADEVAQALVDSADDLGAPGWDPFFGAGQVNAQRALELSTPPAIRFEPVEPIPTEVVPGRSNSFAIKIVGVAEPLLAESPAAIILQPSPALAIPLVSLGDDRYLATLPPTTCGQKVTFFLTATGAEYSVVHHPLLAPSLTHSATAIVRRSIFTDDFETDRGWTTGAGGDPDTAGHWTREAPIGTSAQPNFDRSPNNGRVCFLTQQHLPGAVDDGVGDVDFGPVWLTSPSVHLPPAEDIEVSYSRWFHWNGQKTEDFLTVEFSRDDGATWTLIEVVASELQWVDHRFLLSDFPETQGNQLRVRFTTSDLPNDSLTEAAIDEFRVDVLDCSARLGDANLDGAVDHLDFERLIACLAGPAAPFNSGLCTQADFNDDLRVDLADFTILQRAQTNP